MNEIVEFTPTDLATVGVRTKRTISFFAHGVPVPGGSKRGFVNPKTGRVIITDDAGHKNKNWRAVVVAAGAAAMGHGELLSGPIYALIHFHMPRPKAHFGTGRNADVLKRNAPNFHTKKPDVLKLARAVEDALTNVVWRDDCLVVHEHLVKVYSSRGAGAYIQIMELDDG